MLVGHDDLFNLGDGFTKHIWKQQHGLIVLNHPGKKKNMHEWDRLPVTTSLPEALNQPIHSNHKVNMSSIRGVYMFKL